MQPSLEAVQAQIAETDEHIAKVRGYLGEFAKDIVKRGQLHDLSKYTEAELLPLSRLRAVVMQDGPCDFGTVQYERRTFMIKEAVELHRKRNRHHPEYHPNGVSDMNLLDFVEMLFDWVAASHRDKNFTGPNLDLCAQKYNLTETHLQLITATLDCYKLPYFLKGKKHNEAPTLVVSTSVSTGNGSSV